MDLARLFGLFVAELAVDHWLPDPWYYICPMDFAWAVDIIRRAAVECKEREIRRPKLYESLDFLEQQLDEKSIACVPGCGGKSILRYRGSNIPFTIAL